MENISKYETKLECILSEKQLHYILTKTAKPGAEIISYDLKPATQGLAGFLGDHLRLTLHVKEDFMKNINLFIKTLPMRNQPKAEFIRQNSFYEREALLFKLFEEIGGSEDPNPWRPKALIYAENILVMPDLSVEGYKSYPTEKYFDKNHVIMTVASLARFHATFSNYVTKKTRKEGYPYSILDDYADIMTEPNFFDSPWLRTAARLNGKFLKELSIHSRRYPEDLEDRLVNLYIKGCDSLKVYEDTLNVIIHKDLWSNNIFFRYSGDVVTNALLIDYQCMRYGPPAFDIMVFLHLNTSRKFRECHESEILNHYYSIFSESLDDDTKRRMKNLNYDLKALLQWCDKARLFGMIYAAAIFPYCLMDPVKAQQTYDNPETFNARMVEDRSVPVIQHARENASYRNRQLEICEELVEKYILVQ